MCRQKENSFIWKTRVSSWGSTETGRGKEIEGCNSLTLDFNFLEKIKDNPHMKCKYFLLLTHGIHPPALQNIPRCTVREGDEGIGSNESLLGHRCCKSIWYKLSHLNVTKPLEFGKVRKARLWEPEWLPQGLKSARGKYNLKPTLFKRHAMSLLAQW